jgi:hypothetical protein
MIVKPLIETPSDRLDEFHVRKGRVRFLCIPRHRFAMLDGSGPPEAGLAARIPALYAIAYGLRFAVKDRDVEAKVTPLEGLWWSDGIRGLDAIGAPDGAPARWTLMIGIPEIATDDETDAQLAVARGRIDPAIAASLRTEWFDEGDVAQVLHIGRYAEERPTIERLHQAIRDAGFEPRGRHHEIYVGDPRRSAPERLRTVLRQPVVPSASDASEA